MCNENASIKIQDCLHLACKFTLLRAMTSFTTLICLRLIRQLFRTQFMIYILLTLRNYNHLNSQNCLKSKKLAVPLEKFVRQDCRDIKTMNLIKQLESYIRSVSYTVFGTDSKKQKNTRMELNFLK